jgi:hypothetical protein
MRRLFAALMVFALAAGPAAASDELKKPSSSVLMSPVALPVIVDGKLANYIYITLRLNLAPKADSGKLREKEPFFRDALLRAAYRSPLHKADDPNSLDPIKLRVAVMRESAAIAGPGQVVSFQLIRAQPQRYIPRPNKPAPPKS